MTNEEQKNSINENNSGDEKQDFTIHVFGNTTNFNLGVDRVTTVSTNQTQTSSSYINFTEKIASWNDPLFQTKSTCVQRITYPGGWTCTGWKTEKRFYRNEIWITVSTPTVQDLKKAVEDALSDAAVVAAIVGIATGGSAAVAAFKAVFVARLKQKVKDAIVDVSQRGGWGSWH